jgi:hypothetical protein
MDRRTGWAGPVKYRPSDAELLDAVASLLEEQVMPAVPAGLAHQVRVAANLCRILQRQEAIEPAARQRERQALLEVLDPGGDPGWSLPGLRAELDRRIRAGDPHLERRLVWETLVATARDDLAAAKPGYDVWELG